MNQKDVEVFEKTSLQIRGFYDEISLLAKKSPDGPINKFKLNFINQALITINEILTDQFIPFTDFKTFSYDEVPTNSDVVLMLSQYLSSIIIFFDAHTSNIGYTLYWVVDGSVSNKEPLPNFKLIISRK